jgi:PAS domain S-box-containing protein
MRGNIISCNELVLNYTGYTRKELIGKNFIKLKLLKVTDIHRLTRIVLKILKEKKIPKFEISWKHKKGTSYIGEARLRIIKEENKITGFHIAVMDITYKKNTEDFIKLQRDLATKLSSVSNLKKAFELCVDIAIKAAGMDCCGVYLLDRKTQDINLSYSKGLPNSFIKSALKYSKDSPNAKLVMAGKPIYSQHHKLGVPLDKNSYKEKLLATAIIPIKHEGSVIACLNIASHTSSEIPVNTRNILESIANQTGCVIARIAEREALKESEENYRLLVENQTDIVSKVDNKGRYLFVSPSYCKLFGKTEKELIGKASMSLVHKDDKESTAIAMKKATKPPYTSYIEQRAMTKHGWRWISWAVKSIFDKNNNIIGAVASGRDITDRKKVEEELNESEREGKYLDVNQALVKMLGYKNKEELLNIDIPTQLYVKISDRPGPKYRKKTFTTQLRRKDGSIIWAEINSVVIHNIDDTIYYEGIVRDITDKKKAEEKLKYLSFHDKLTGLYNRAYFEEELSRLDTERQLPISAVICDLNSLKLVNDAFGHYEGDKLLKKVSNLIKI